MGFREKIGKGKFVITTELTPPCGVNIDSVLRSAEFLKNKVDAINVTDMAGGIMRLGSLSLSHLIKEKGGEPIFQITGAHRNRLALQSEILSASVLGIENVLCLSGDPPLEKGEKPAKPVFDLDSVGILKMIKRMEEGYDLSGRALEGRVRFFCGAAVDPNAENIEFQIEKMKRKIEAGARFFQTQPVFNLDKFKRFMEKAGKLEVPILAGIIFLKNRKSAEYLNRNILGISIPAEMIRRIEEAKEKEKESVEIAWELIRDLRGLCQGIHLMPLGKNELVNQLIEKMKRNGNLAGAPI